MCHRSALLYSLIAFKIAFLLYYSPGHYSNATSYIKIVWYLQLWQPCFWIMQAQTDKNESRVIIGFCAGMPTYFCSMMEFFSLVVSFTSRPILQLSAEMLLENLFQKTVGFMFSYHDTFIVFKVFSSLLYLGCLRDLEVDRQVGHHQQARGVNITHAKCGINAEEAVYLVKFHQGQVTQQLQTCPRWPWGTRWRFEDLGSVSLVGKPRMWSELQL